MTPQRRQREVSARKHRRLSTGLETVDAQWRAYHRYLYRICAAHLSPSDELAQFAITVADSDDLSRLVDRALSQKEYLKLPPDTVAELESLKLTTPSTPDDAPRPSPSRLRHLCLRVARHNETLHPTVVDLVAGDADAPFACPPFPAIASEVARIFSLSPTHEQILMALYALEDIEAMSDIMRQATHRTQMNILADAAEVDLATFVRETAPGAHLERLGLIGYRGGRDEIADINVSRPLLFALRSNTLDDLKAGLFDVTPPPQFDLSDFSLSPDELRTCATAVRSRHPLLIAGEPGIGKTEFARALAVSLGRRAHTLATLSRRSENVRGPRGEDSEANRFNAIRMAANLLTSATDVLIIDEADTVLQSATGIFSLFGGGTYDKALLNDLLEHLPVATIWITNDHHMIPSSALRRFGHVLAFPHPSIDTRVRMLSERLVPLATTIDDVSATAGTAAWTRDLAARYDITPAAIDRAARIIAAELDAEELASADVRDRITGYIDQISTGALAHDVRRLPTVATTFDPRFCSTTEPLDRVERQAVHRAQAGSGLRLLFGGPPGGGKTQYALWLAKRLGRDVTLKRPSDLLSKYVGESEQQIAAAFRAAERAGSVLIIDEADALLYDRSIAKRSWEHSQIAEFLQQIQEFSGILIACTNRVDAVDPALRRRFHKHVTFDAISDEILPGALAHIFPEVSFSDVDLAALRQGPPLMMSDLATAAEMMEIDGLDDGDEPSESTPAAAVVEEILANARSRDRTRGIGF